MQEDRDKVKKKSFSKKKLELEEVEYSQAIHTAKHEKACFEENTKGGAGRAIC